MIVGNLVAGKRIAQACGRDVTQLEDNDQASKVQSHPTPPTHPRERSSSVARNHAKPFNERVYSAAPHIQVRSKYLESILVVLLCTPAHWISNRACTVYEVLNVSFK